MTDTLTPQRRSWNMSRIRSTNTAPELQVRSLIHRMGCRFRLHRYDLPGRPDIVLPKFSLAVFVHGCFWHRHRGCRFSYSPKTRVEFWQRKFACNQERDRAAQRKLKSLGWSVLIVWECELRYPDRLRRRIARAIGIPVQ